PFVSVDVPTFLTCFSSNSQGGRFTSSFFFSSRRRHTRSKRDWSSDVCSSDLNQAIFAADLIEFLQEVLCADSSQCELFCCIMGYRNLAGGCHAENRNRHFRAAETAAGDRTREGCLHPGTAESRTASSGRSPGSGRGSCPAAEEAVWQFQRGDAGAGGRKW